MKKLILDIDNWQRKGKGKYFNFTIDIINIYKSLIQFLPSKFRPYSIVTSEFVKVDSIMNNSIQDDEIYEQKPITFPLSDIESYIKNNYFFFFLKSEKLTINNVLKQGDRIDAIYSLNGLLNIQIGRSRNNKIEPNSIGIVDKIENITNGEIIVHQEYLLIYNALKKGLYK